MRRRAAIAFLVAVVAGVLATPMCAIAAPSIDASPVVSVAGSVSTVDGTVSISPMSIVALANAIQSVPTSVTLGPAWDEARDTGIVVGLVGVFIGAIAVAFLIGKG